MNAEQLKTQYTKDKEPPYCWHWTGLWRKSKNPVPVVRYYDKDAPGPSKGVKSRRSRVWGAPRLLYKLVNEARKNGKSLPDGRTTVMLRRCESEDCVNPDHYYFAPRLDLTKVSKTDL